MTAPLLPLITLSNALAVAIGAALGGVLRWSLGVLLAQASQPWPWATLLVNLLGGLCMGACVAWFSSPGATSPALRLFCTVGLLGGFTTFSAFSAESLALLLAGHTFTALLHSLAHTLGALLMTAAGYALVVSLLIL